MSNYKPSNEISDQTMKLDPFAGLIQQILAYQPPPKTRRYPHIDPYDRILAVQRMARGESPTEIAREMGVTKDAVIKWQAKARAEAEAWEAERV